MTIRDLSVRRDLILGGFTKAISWLCTRTAGTYLSAILFVVIATVLPASVASGSEVCGDGIAEGGECCDDGNTVSGDGCHGDCSCDDSAEQHQTLDDLFAAVAQQVPEFGGMFLGRNEETLQVYLTDVSPGKVAAVEMAIVDVFGADIIPEGGIKRRRGRYGFLQLREWYTEMVGTILRTPGVTGTDINEAVNRLVIGVSQHEDRQRVRNALKGLSIPLNVVKINVTGPIVPLGHTVQSTFSPIQGGYQVSKGGGICTLGFNAFRSLVRGFVTNSHCTNVTWAFDGGTFLQGTTLSPVGTEMVDPPGFPCPPPYLGSSVCRWSDSAFVRYYSNTPWDFGIIAKTVGLTTAPATPILGVDEFTVDPGWNMGPGRFAFTGPPSQPYLFGLLLNKVGRTTGWTNGQIISTCVDYAGGGPNSVLRCQYAVGNLGNGIVNYGDSGSPVFRSLNDSTQRVELYGILWGGQTSSQYPQEPPSYAFRAFVFSPITGVQADLGLLDTHLCAWPVSWWDGSQVQPGFDSRSCFVSSAPTSSMPFVDGVTRKYYIQAMSSGPPCPSGGIYDSINGGSCYMGTAPLGTFPFIWPPSGSQQNFYYGY